ncbi:F0F1 ATP synthase subunit B' [Rhodovarius crocodyli]|uniref:ATP synthase subunit b n=1 Tax=Rhodovarius crocodyli TaxID=1979269 RepID=A0A437MHE4_9PROT|nr:F0F1 ATP synthase subunit B' [Rhodovarius crocodyli]RVT97080.1 F0F1 ATP synthase subunit B' [Rhodovarius crocodyli]
MPQFQDPLLLSQAVWLLIIFGAFYFVLSSFVLPRVGSVLEDRAARISADLEAARASKQQADAALAELNAATAKARAEAQAAIAAAVADANAKAQAEAEALNAKLSQQIDAAEARISTARDAAMSAIGTVATETATALVSKLIGHADANAVQSAVGRSLASRGAA